MTIRIKCLILVLLPIISFSTVFISCNIFNEPEPYINNNAHSPELLQWKNIQDGKHIAGIIILSFFQDSDSSEVIKITLSIDADDKGQVQYPVKIDTRNYPDGEHLIKCNVWLKDKMYGLGNIQPEPTQTIQIKLVFNQTAPQAPNAFSIHVENNYPRLNWEPVSDKNFYEYIIRRNGKRIANLKMQDISVFVDSSYTIFDFDKVSYEVGTSNSVNTTYAATQTLTKGESLSFAPTISLFDGFYDKCILHTYGGWLNQYISCISNNTLEIYGKSSPGYPTGRSYNHTYPYSLSLDLQRFFWWRLNGGPEIEILNLNRLERKYLLRPEYYKGSFIFAVGLKDNLYVAYETGKLKIITGQYDPHYKTYNLFENFMFDGLARFLSISPDGQTMLAADNHGVKKLLITDSSAEFDKQSEIHDKIGIFRPDWKNSRFFITRQKTILEIWNIQNLQPISSFIISSDIQATNEITAITANSKNIYAAYTIEQNNSDASIIVEYNIETKEQQRIWSVNKVVQSLAVSHLGKYLFAFTPSDQWIISVGEN